jgi:regulator of sirC expression with transglutaminase-like and TPR domain
MEPQGCVYPQAVMDARETMNVSLGRTLLVVAASDGPPWTATS